MFEPDYDLMPLGELEAYIKEHKHLPNVQSAEQMTEDGIKLTEFSMVLLEKLEELTLYTLLQQRSFQEQQRINEEQQSTIEELEARLKALEGKGSE